MTLHKKHRTPRTFNCLRRIVIPNKRCFRITQHPVRIQKSNQTDGKHNLILINARYFHKYTCTKISLFGGETFRSLLVARYFLVDVRYLLLVGSYFLLITFCSLLDKKFWRIFFSKSKQKLLHINLYKKFNLLITLKLRQF